MCKDWVTDEQVEIEIQRLTCCEEVRLARKEMRLKYKRRQAMYQLRNLEKRGKQLMEMGITMDNIEYRLFGDVEEMEEV